MRQRLAGHARSGVGDQRDAGQPQARPARGDGLQHGRHADRIGAQGAEHAHLGRRLVVRPDEAGVDALLEPDALQPGRRVEASPEVGVPGIGQVGEARADAIGVGTEQWVEPGQVEVVGERHQGARRPGGVDAPSRVGEQDPWRAESSHEQDGLDHETRGMAFIQMQTTLEADDRHAPDLAQEQPAGMPRRRGRRPAREICERDDHRRLEPLGQAAEPGAQDDAEAWDQVGARTDRRLERVQAGRQVAGVEGVGHGRQDTPRRSPAGRRRDAAGW